MLKRLMSAALVLVGAVSAFAQTPLPEDPNVKHGTLPNGMNYYIMHNAEPKERANFYIAQKVGSTLETPTQLGLAHFLEHMAFNGTKNFPGKAMLNYLQNKGIRFGADINAYTSFDETVYRVNNVPTTDAPLMDSVLLVLHDWSCDLTLATEEINAERGVIQEEWRMRNDAGTRMYTAMLPAVYEEPQYKQMPIGTMDVVMNFDPQELRDYYHKWYRPDQQGIIIVGDFDAAEMEKKVVALFSPIPMPENAAPRVYPTVSDNKEPIYFEFQDPELTYTMASIAFKSDKTPFEARNTVEGFAMDVLLPDVICTLLNNRLEEFGKEADCAYSFAGTDISDFLVSKTKDSFNLQVIAKNDVKKAFSQAMGIVARACKTGFTDSELTRAKDEILAEYEKAYNERNTTNSDKVAQKLIRHFVDNAPAPGIETEKQLADALANQMINVQLINEVCKQLLTPENQVVMVCAPTSNPLPGKEIILGDVKNALDSEYEAYVDEVITDPLIPKYLKAGKIKSVTENKEFGTTEFILSNGVKVVVKPTDFAADEILMTAFRKGGKQTYPTTQAANLDMIESAYEASRLGSFDTKTLTKYLAGKNASLSYGMGVFTNYFNGKSTVKDFETLLDLTYASFTALGNDQATYDSDLSRTRGFLENAEKNPMFTFQREQMKTIYGNNPMAQVTDLKTLDAANYGEMMNIIRQTTANAADYTFIFTGNVDVEKLKPMLEKYIASLPSKKKAIEPKKVTDISMVKGKVDNSFDIAMQTPSTMIMDIYNGYKPFSNELDVTVDILGQILSDVYTQTLREEEGGSYSPYAFGQYNPVTEQWCLFCVVQTNADQQAQMIKRANEEALKLMKQGATAEQFNRMKEATLKQYETQVRTNSYWSSGLQNVLRGHNTITGYRQAIEGLTLDKFNENIRNLWDGQNLIQIVMTGVPEKK